jgi:hypothetical protein
MHSLLKKAANSSIDPEDEIMLRAKVVTSGMPLLEQSRALRHTAQRMMQESKRLKRIGKEK